LNPEVYGALLEEWHGADGARLDSLEREAFGFDHAQVGALMAEDWGLPEYLVDSIRRHHDHGSEARVDPAVRLVSLMRYFPERDGRERIVEVAEAEYGIEPPQMEEMISRAFAEADQFAGMFYE
jgi:HD-like signal output (HDOD) protein